MLWDRQKAQPKLNKKVRTNFSPPWVVSTQALFSKHLNIVIKACCHGLEYLDSYAPTRA